MVQSPSWEANRFAATQEIPPILWNPNIYYRQIDPVSTFRKFILILFFHLRLGFPSDLLPSGFHAKTL
jgi:hypothetical protein